MQVQVTNQYLKNCAARILEQLNDEDPSAGEVDQLSEEIAEILIKNHGIPQGRL